ncbi:MAG: glycosyltransferase family 4 protein [Candidatus Bathyarchaeota archaeon]|nr:glycosyltransferase family 4 protein [Candidatus Bathyarchaeota archaeon]
MMSVACKNESYSNVNVLLLPSPPTFDYPATKNIWDYLRILCRHAFVGIRDNNFAFIFSKDLNPCYKIKLTKGIIGKIINNIRLLEVAHLQKVDVVLLHQQLFDPLSLLLAKVILRKKILFFVGASRFQIFKINSTSGLFTFSELLNDILNYILIYFFQILLSDEIILVTNRFYQTEPLLSFFKFKTCVAYDIPSKSFFDEMKPQRNVMKRKNIVCYIGSARFIKGFHVFINAARLLSSENNLQFLVIGEHNKCEPQHLNEYLNLEEVKKRFKNIQFVGRIPHSALVDYLRNAKLLVLPSFSEGLPAAVVEAMACGTPVLATPVGAICDLIKDRQTGSILQENSPTYVSERMLRILAENELLQTISKKSSEFVRDFFSFEKSLAIWRKILHEI